VVEKNLEFSSGYDGLTPQELVLLGVRGREAMSTLYEYELTLEVRKDGGLSSADTNGLLTNTCFVHGVEGEGGSFELHGILRRIELIDASSAMPVLYRAILVPQLWNTTRSFRSRVYQDKDVQGIVDEVLALSALEAEWHLAESYPVSEYVVQYEESDFVFISRLLEHWGIAYHFRQDPDGEILAITDSNAFFEPLSGFEELTFNPRLDRSSAQGSVHSILSVFEPQPESLTAREYNWRTPSTPLKVDHDVDTETGVGMQWLYGDHFKDADEGAMVARIRAEQMLNLRETFHGVCSVRGLAPGHKFSLVNCPLPDLNITYLVTSVEPSVSTQADAGDESRQLPFTAVALERDDPPPLPYRSQRVTLKPRIMGFMHGHIDGESPGTAAPIDPQGRYKVLLPLDSVAEVGGKATRWIRMVQASAGMNYGIHFPLHVGIEVAIIHLDGDPDRPVIVGAVPNPETMSPVVQEEATMSRIRTPSGIEISMNDDV
jgi:type VI secretion system secreted protein VgrG